MNENKRGTDILKRLFLVAFAAVTVLGTCHVSGLSTVAASANTYTYSASGAATETVTVVETENETENEDAKSVVYVAEEKIEVTEPVEEPVEEPVAEPEPELPAYTVEDYEAVLYVNRSCNVRKGPSTDYEIVGGYGLNREVRVTGIASTGWYRIKYNGAEAYIADSLLSDTPVVIEPEPEPQPEVQPETQPEPQPEPAPQAPTRTPIAMDPAPSAAEQALIDSILASIITPEMDDFQVAVAINDYICATTTYTYGYYTAYECLANGRAVCQGYANAYWRLMNAAGIPTDYVGGYAYNGVETGRHGWNRSLIGGVYYYTDVTWNDTCRNAYLLLSYDQMAEDHFEETINRYRDY